MEKVIAKLKNVLSKEDLEKVAKTMKTMVNEAVIKNTKVVRDRMTVLAEEFVAKEIEQGKKQLNEDYSKKLEADTKTINEEYANKMTSFENTMVERFDKFIDSEIAKNISDDTLNKVAINEMYKPLIEGIQNLFEEKYVALDVEGYGLIKEAKQEIDRLETRLTKEIAEKIELNESINKVKTELNESINAVKKDSDKFQAKYLVETKISGLTDSQKKRVRTLLEGKSVKDITSKIDAAIDMIIEEDKPVKSEKKKNLNEDINDGANGINASDELSPKKDTMEDAAERLV